MDAWRIDSRGRVSTSVQIKTDSALRKPEIHTSVEIGDCDDGLSWSAGKLVCDRALFGHAYLMATAGVVTDAGGLLSPSLTNAGVHLSTGIYWEPSSRSPWRASVAISSAGTLQMGVSRGFKLF